MKKKNIRRVFIYLFALIALFSFGEEVRADAGVYGQCTYTYEGYTVVVQELKDQKINVTASGGSASEKKYSNNLSKNRKYFFQKNGVFYCPDVYVVNEIDGSKATITTDPGKKNYTTISGTYESEYESACTYSANGNSVTITPKKGGGTDVKFSPSGRTYWQIDDSVFYKDGSFKCIDPSEVALQICTFDINKDKKYWTLSSNDTDYCGDKADKEVVTPEKIIKKEVTKSSTWNSDDGNTSKFLKKIWGMLRVLVPALVIILSIVDFLKVVFLSEEKVYKDAYNKLLKRIAVGIILFVVPSLVKLVLDLAGLKEIGLPDIFDIFKQ